MTQPNETQEIATDPAPTEVLLTRSQAARRMGVSVATIRRMEGVSIDPIVLDGRHFFRAEDIDHLRPRTDGEIAGRAFAGFESGQSIIEVVIALEQPPDAIEALHKKWVELSRSLVVRGFDDWRWTKDIYRTLGLPMLTPYAVQQCLAIVAASEENRDRLRRALRGEPVVLESVR